MTLHTTWYKSLDNRYLNKGTNLRENKFARGEIFMEKNFAELIIANLGSNRKVRFHETRIIYTNREN